MNVIIRETRVLWGHYWSRLQKPSASYLWPMAFIFPEYALSLLGTVGTWNKMAHKENGTIRRCGFVGVGVALLQELRHCGGWL